MANARGRAAKSRPSKTSSGTAEVIPRWAGSNHRRRTARAPGCSLTSSSSSSGAACGHRADEPPAKAEAMKPSRFDPAERGFKSRPIGNIARRALAVLRRCRFAAFGLFPAPSSTAAASSSSSSSYVDVDVDEEVRSIKLRRSNGSKLSSSTAAGSTYDDAKFPVKPYFSIPAVVPF